MQGKYVDNSFRLGLNCPESTAFEDCSMVVTSIETFKNTEISVQIYPNPASDYLKVSIKSGTSHTEITGAKIYNMSAKLVYQAARHEEIIDLEGMVESVYFIQFETNTEQITKKKIIQ